MITLLFLIFSIPTETETQYEKDFAKLQGLQNKLGFQVTNRNIAYIEPDKLAEMISELETKLVPKKELIEMLLFQINVLKNPEFVAWTLDENTGKWNLDQTKLSQEESFNRPRSFKESSSSSPQSGKGQQYFEVLNQLDPTSDKVKYLRNYQLSQLENLITRMKGITKQEMKAERLKFRIKRRRVWYRNCFQRSQRSK